MAYFSNDFTGFSTKLYQRILKRDRCIDELGREIDRYIDRWTDR